MEGEGNGLGGVCVGFTLYAGGEGGLLVSPCMQGGSGGKLGWGGGGPICGRMHAPASPLGVRQCLRQTYQR